MVRRMFGARVQGGRGEVQSALGVLLRFRFVMRFVSLAHSIIAYCIDRNIPTAVLFAYPRSTFAVPIITHGRIQVRLRWCG